VSLRNVSVWYAVLGMLAASAALLVGLDVCRAARRGPRWKRRLLSAGLAVLVALGIASCDRKPDSGVIMCYMPMPAPAVMSLSRLEAQLTVLDKLTAEERLDRAVVEKVLASIEGDLKTLSDPDELAGLPESERVRARAMVAGAREKVKAVRARLEEPKKAGSGDMSEEGQ
jgi:hypothetical protein